jgi:hypothetical protein
MRFILQRKETCISILAGYMGIKGIYNFPPNLPKQKKITLNLISTCRLRPS